MTCTGKGTVVVQVRVVPPWWSEARRASSDQTRWRPHLRSFLEVDLRFASLDPFAHSARVGVFLSLRPTPHNGEFDKTGYYKCPEMDFKGISWYNLSSTDPKPVLSPSPEMNGTQHDILEGLPTSLEFSKLVHISRPVLIKSMYLNPDL